MKKKGVLSLDDTHLTHYGSNFEKIANLWDPVERRYTWAHNLVTLHYSDEQTNYPVAFQLWEPADLAKLEKGLLEAGIHLRAKKFALKESDPKKWRQYLLGVWRRHQDKAEVAALYQSKLLIARHQLAEFVTEHPMLKLPVTSVPVQYRPRLLRERPFPLVAVWDELQVGSAPFPARF